MKEKYGLLTPIEYLHSKIKKSDQFWLFKCDCGKEKISRLYDVIKGKINFNNRNLNLSEWSDITGIKPTTISKRIDKYGWSVEEALTRKPK
jgi:hypothetical protein